MPNISLSQQGRGVTPSVLPFAQASVANPSSETATRAKRSPASITVQNSPWTLQPLPTPSTEASAAADRWLLEKRDEPNTRHAAHRKVQLQPAATIFPLFDAYRRALNSPELRAWFQSKGIVLSSLVVRPDSVSGSVTKSGVSSVQTFTTHDFSGWWQVSAKLRAAVQALDSEGKGLPYVHQDADTLPLDSVLRWYSTPSSVNTANMTQSGHELTMADRAALESRVQTARHIIDDLDDRAHLASTLTHLIADKADDEEVSLADLKVQLSSTSALVRDATGNAPIGDVLQTYGLPLPKTAGELRNAVCWLKAALPSPPLYGNYTSDLLSKKWSPGSMSDADKNYLIQLNNREDPKKSSAYNLLAALDVENSLLDRYSSNVLRTEADRFLGQLLSHEQTLHWGEMFAQEQGYHGASGTTQMSDAERRQWLIAAIKLQIDPDAPGRAGTIAGYDIYQPGNSGRSLAEVRAKIETQLKKNPLLNPKAAPLVSHLFLASVAPEFLVRDTPTTLRVGTLEWADLRLGVAIAENLGGPGTSRVMSYKDLISLTRLGPRTPEEAAVLDNYGVDALLDWGLMQGVYSQPADGLYTPQMHQDSTEAFTAQRNQLLSAFTHFNEPLPTRENLAIQNLKGVFPEYSVKQLLAMRVHTADRDKIRNSKSSEPQTRSLVETYMTDDLTKNQWMLLQPGEPIPTPAKQITPFDFNRGFSKKEQEAIDENVKDLNARVANLPNLETHLSAEVDTYLSGLKLALSVFTKRMISNLSLPVRQALEFGTVQVLALRENVPDSASAHLTPEQVDERRGRKGSLITCKHLGVSYVLEVFPDKMLIVERDDLVGKLKLGGAVIPPPPTLISWVRGNTQRHVGDEVSIDFTAYSTDALPRPDAKSKGIIIEQLGDTFSAPPPVPGDEGTVVPESFFSERTEAIVDRIMQGNFVHHRDSVLKIAHGELPLEQQREVLKNNDRILLSMIPFVGAIMDLAEGNIVDGTKGLLLDTAGAFLGGAGSTLKAFAKATKVLAPFGAKSMQVLESGVRVVNGFLNPFAGTAKIMVGATRGLVALPKLSSKGLKPPLTTTLWSVEEKMRTFFNTREALKKNQTAQADGEQPATHNGHNNDVPVNAVQVGEYWYATNPATGLPLGTPMPGYKPLSATSV
ncbi:hypothetical protein [Pseudomonas sp. 1152_12]|uniref:hypothetical protein n=1 Tax=Pseudomonas sp. 1152_12 TaxID=2604455 RepID=UPI004063A259